MSDELYSISHVARTGLGSGLYKLLFPVLVAFTKQCLKVALQAPFSLTFVFAAFPRGSAVVEQLRRARRCVLSEPRRPLRCVCFEQVIRVHGAFVYTV